MSTSSVTTRLPSSGEVPAPSASEKPERPWAIRSLPPFPAVALQLMSLLDDAEAPMRQVVNLLRVDPALSAEILRVANSALYGLSGNISNVSHAVVVLGSDSVRRLSLTVALGRFSSRFLRHQGLRTCWDHSVAAGMVAEELAELLNQPKDRAYTAGLLHDIGRLALLACHPNEYGNLLAVVRENDFDELEGERQMFDVDHCAAGEWLGRHWNLPGDMVAAIATHHQRSPDDASIESIVAAAARIADALGFPVIKRESVEEPLDWAELLRGLPVPDPDKAAARLEGFDERIRSAIATVSPSR